MATKTTTAPAIGIDFGTTSRVSVFRNGKVEMIPNRFGNMSTPNYVTFTDTGCFVGDAAKAKISSLDRNLVNTVFDVKRFMGAQYYSVHRDTKYYPFEVISDKDDDDQWKIKFSVDSNGENRTIYPEEILTMILSELKNDAETFLEMAVTNAVITVPPTFKLSLRYKIKEAAASAGLNVLRLVDDSTIASLTYCLLMNNEETVPIKDDRNVLIFDLGGGNLSITIVTIDDDGVVEVKSIAGNPHLGGVDFDNRMVAHCIKEIKKKHGRDFNPNKWDIFRLRTACQKAKEILSRETQTSIQIDNLFDSIDFHSSITRSLFVELNKDLFNRILKTVEKALRDARIDKSNINDIVMLGGSTHIPKIQNKMKRFFNGKELNFSVDQEEAVVRGAAVQAAILTGENDNSPLHKLLLLDVIPASLGVENVGGKIKRVIKRCTTIPIKRTVTITACADFQREVLIKVYEGEHRIANKSYLLGELKLRVTQLCGNQEIEVTIDVSSNGIITVTAVECLNKSEAQIKIGLKYKEVQTKAYLDEREQISSKRRLEHYTSGVQNILDKIIKVKSWLSDNQNAKKEEYEKKKKYLEDVCQPFIIKLTDEDNANANATSNGAETNQQQQQSTRKRRRSCVSGESEEENKI